MRTRNTLSRRSFLAMTATVPLWASLANGKEEKIPVGLELYSVRGELKKDLPGTVRAVAKMGYQCVEFYAPYYEWTPEYARQIRQELDELGCAAIRRTTTRRRCGRKASRKPSN